MTRVGRTREGVDAGCDATSGDEGERAVDTVSSRRVVVVARAVGFGLGRDDDDDGGCASAVGAAV